MNTLSGVVASLKDSRNSFVRDFYQYEKVVKANKECPMCGFEWSSVEELKLNIQKQEEKVNLLTKETGIELDSSLEKFGQEFVAPLQAFFQSYLAENKVDDIFVKGLQEAAKNKDEIKKLYVEIESHNIQVKKFITDSATIGIDKNMAALKREIDSKKHPINVEKIQSYFADYFIKYFNQKEDLLNKITPEDVKKKKEYLAWKYSIYQSGVLKNKRQELEIISSRYDGALNLKSRLTSLKKIYENSLNNYQQKIIGDIEILFHIYSGRIIQDSQGGMGLFISDKNGIRFLEDPKKNHDAVFTMSSGQLAVLIIAFTLTLNKRYSENKMLFIDDPVQTLDELNISSLIELLRNEFADRQIFLSTHEDKMSAYMRYKFEKHGLKTGRLSFKDRYLNSKV
jgi:DNA repair protein SbcC/Rad50